MTNYIWLDHGIKLYNPEPIQLGGLKCTYCGGTVIGSLKHELIRTKRQLPAGATDMHIYDEEKRSIESYTCSTCKGLCGGYSEYVRPCTRCHRETIRANVALTWPDLPVQLSLKNHSESVSNSSSGCTLCVKCRVCEQPLNSRDIVDARVVTEYGYLGDATLTEHYYSHVQCVGRLIAGVTSSHQKMRQKKIAENKGPKKSPWWKRL